MLNLNYTFQGNIQRLNLLGIFIGIKYLRLLLSSSKLFQKCPGWGKIVWGNRMLIRVRKFRARCFMTGNCAWYLVSYGSFVLCICVNGRILRPVELVCYHSKNGKAIDLSFIIYQEFGLSFRWRDPTWGMLTKAFLLFWHFLRFWHWMKTLHL